MTRKASLGGHTEFGFTPDSSVCMWGWGRGEVFTASPGLLSQGNSETVLMGLFITQHQPFLLMLRKQMSRQQKMLPFQ